MLRHRRLVVFALALLVATAAAFGGRTRGVRAPSPSSAPTFNKEVVRIFQQNCQSCHRPGDIAPFALTTYADAFLQADNIRYMTQMRKMPPWKPAASCGNFKDTRRLTDSEIDIIARWVEAGAPEGRNEDLPSPKTFEEGWVLGAPDLVLGMSQPFTPTPNREVYRCFPLTTGNNDRRFVSGIDVRPGNRTSVHHVIAFLDLNDASAALDAGDPGPGYTCFGGPGFDAAGALGGWAPGARPWKLDSGVALDLPARSKVVLQVHYSAHGGNSQPDQTQVGIYYSQTAVEKLMHLLPLFNRSFAIPASAKDHKVTSSFQIPLFISAQALNISPHMHLLGKKMKVTATLPDGTTQCLIDIDDWDFNWQGSYRFLNPVALPPTTKLILEAHYDNSVTNPRNPSSPPKEVRWGEATTDEMCIAFIGFTIDGEPAPSSGKGPIDLSWMPAID